MRGVPNLCGRGRCCHRRTVQRHLENWGDQVACAVRFDDMLSEFAAFDPQLALLDISLPFSNGYHWCCEIERYPKSPSCSSPPSQVT